MRNDNFRLLDILEAIKRIDKYAERERDAFADDERIQTWIVHHLHIIGTRHILVHHYFGLDQNAARPAVAGDLPALRQQVTAMRADVNREPEENPS